MLPYAGSTVSASYLLRFDDFCPTMNWDIWDRVEPTVRRLGAKPLLAVIPQNHDRSFRFGPPADDFWQRVRGWQADGWSIGLHGYRHMYVSDQPGLCGTDPRSEFAGISREEQARKLRAGVDIFHRNGVEVDCWIAPNHSFDETTVDLLLELGVDVVSDGFDLLPHRDRRGTLWVPCQLNEFVPRRAGVWTAHFHPNYWSEGRLHSFARDLESFADRIIDLDTVVERYGTRRRTSTDVAYRNYRAARSRLKRLRGAAGAGSPTPPVPVGAGAVSER